MGKWGRGEGLRHVLTDKTWLMPGKLAWGLCSENLCRIKRAEPGNK